MSWPEKLAIGLFGLVIPFSLAWATHNSKPGRSLEYQEFLTPAPMTVWILILILAVFFRFYKLTTLSVWPCYDEGFLNYYAFELSQKWDWRMFYGSSQAPPAYMWIQSFFYKWWGPSLQTLWFLPALASILTLPLGYSAARQYFSKSFSFLLLLFMIGSFWPLYLGRFSLMTSLIPFWECLILWLLGIFLKAPPSHQMPWTVFLGLLVGMGFYIHISWIPIAAIIGLALLVFEWNKKRTLNLFYFFVLAVGLVMAPLIHAALKQNFGLYLKNIWAFSKNDPINIFDQFQVSLGYYSCLLWGLKDSFRAYEPIWGGFFNPLLGSFFLLGLLIIFKNKPAPLKTWLCLALVVFILPESLTKSLEPFRVIPVMIVFFIVIVYGLKELLTFIPKGKRWPVVACIFVISWGLDFYHLIGPYQNVWKTPELWKNFTKSVVLDRAYNYLKERQLKEGPGLIFSDFIPGYSDETLTLADYSFNAVDNPKLSWDKASWAAVLINVHYQPFLKKRFPEGQAYFLSKNIPAANGGEMLWIMPVTPEKTAVLKRWEEASQALKPFINQYISYVSDSSFQPVQDALLQARRFYEGDPFLESIFWEKVADNELKMNDPDHRLAIQAIREAVLKGYPAAHLYYDLGMFYWMDQKKITARQAFEEAVRSPMDFTDAHRMLQELR